MVSIERSEFHQPATHTSRFVQAGGLRLHYLDYGTQGLPPMLCVHGGGAHAHWYDFVAPGFTPDHHVRALDLRGHGDSAWADPPDYAYTRYAQELAEVVEELELRDFVLIGHSMGGMISLLYAATHPGRIGKLVVVDSTMQMNEDRVGNLRNVGARAGGRYATLEAFAQRFRLRPGETTAAPEILAHLAGNSARQAPDGTWRHKFDRNVFAGREPIDGLPYWSRIGIPALLVKGGRSHRITPKIFDQVRARCPQAVLAEIPGADHHVMLDNPAGFVQAVRTFLSRG